jgi:hypothetical protein
MLTSDTHLLQSLARLLKDVIKCFDLKVLSMPKSLGILLNISRFPQRI